MCNEVNQLLMSIKTNRSRPSYFLVILLYFCSRVSLTYVVILWMGKEGVWGESASSPRFNVGERDHRTDAMMNMKKFTRFYPTSTWKFVCRFCFNFILCTGFYCMIRLVRSSALFTGQLDGSCLHAQRSV